MSKIIEINHAIGEIMARGFVPIEIKISSNIADELEKYCKFPISIEEEVELEEQGYNGYLQGVPIRVDNQIHDFKILFQNE